MNKPTPQELNTKARELCKAEPWLRAYGVHDLWIAVPGAIVASDERVVYLPPMARRDAPTVRSAIRDALESNTFDAILGDARREVPRIAWYYARMNASGDADNVERAISALLRISALGSDGTEVDRL